MNTRALLPLLLIPSLGCSSPSSTTPCSAAGSHSSSAASSDPPCCPSLQQLTIGAAGYASAQATRACLPREGDVVVFACSLGTCGDGTCEGAEALPCGCAADCPSAAWGPTLDAGVSRAATTGADGGVACSTVGSYPHSQSFTSAPCCAGLTRLELRLPLFDGDTKACVQDDPLSFACIAGSCGDGRCETPEAVPCACPPDCESARWEQ